MNNLELKIGIVGCGGISRFHTRAYLKAEGARIAKVFDMHADSAHALAGEVGADACASLEDMLRPGDLDAVSICTPPGAHLESCLPFINAGIPVLCEKPLAGNLDEAFQLEAAVHQSGTPFMIGFCHRFNPAVVKVKQMLMNDGDRVGKPLFFRNLFGGLIDVMTGHRGDPAVSGGGVLIDNCAHSLDLFRFLMGEVESIQAQVKNLVQPSRVEDYASIGVLGRDSIAGQIASSYSLPVAYNSVEIFCSKSTLSINYQIRGRPDLAAHYQGEQKEQAVLLDHDLDQFTAEISYFLSCVRLGARPIPGIEDAIENARLIDAAYRSAYSA